MPQNSQPSYEYRGLIAEVWDQLRGDTSGWPDRSFYRDLILEVGEPVLDVGCGTGRLLLDYASEGIDVDGVDNSPEMLALCRKKAAALDLRPTLFEQQMETLELPRRYRAIIVPSSSFQLVIETDDAREAMRRFHDHLEPGGSLAMSFMLMWSGTPQTTEQANKWHKRKRVGEREDGSTVRRWTRARYDSEAQLEHTEDRYEIIVDGEIVETEKHSRSPSARWYTQDQSRALYEEAGFVDVLLYSGFSKDAASADDRMWAVVGRRAADLE
ncbi:MAG: class I SAM-dependent methyltransferase [Chloroflexi bacterium]|nr:class I SAM-dependent methyltransferase [Chloroflexota bacterium]